VTRQRTDEQRKSQIRAAAIRCFVRRGFEATRLLDIANEAGLSKGGVYFHFRAKEAIFQDVLKEYAGMLADRWDFSPVIDQSADRTMGQLVASHVRTMLADPNEVRLFNLLVAMAAQDQVFRAKLGDILEIMKRVYRPVIERGIADGVFVDGDTDRLAVSVVAYISGLSAFAAFTEEGGLPVTPEHAGEQVLRMLRMRSSVSAVEFASPSSGSGKPPPN